MNIHITETVLRDANQSLIATRLPLADFLPILSKIDAVGYHSIECWGGATFDACLRYLKEDPWERLRTIRQHVPNTPLQMLLRGQNLLGYRHYADDTVRRFVAKSIENGIDILRIFDALNDLRNVQTAVDATIAYGGHAQGTICYTLSPIHTLPLYVDLGKQIEAMGCHSLCIKDMAGIMSPQVCFDLVSALKEVVSIPIYVHTHATTGLGAMTYLKAAQAGATGIDCAISPFAGGTSQPATESLVYALSEMGFDTGIDQDAMAEVAAFFSPLRQKFLADGTLDPYVLSIKPDALTSQIPGGMLSNLVAQLKAQQALDRLPEVLAEVPRVRADLGYPPLVTPLSQMVGVQATVNVLLGKRYQNIGSEIKAYIRGEYGKPPAPICAELMEAVLGQEKPLTGRYADQLAPEFETVQEELGTLARTEEDVLSAILFPAQAKLFLQHRQDGQTRQMQYGIREE